MHRQEKIAQAVQDHVRVLENVFERQSDEMIGFAERVVETFHQGGRLYVAGSGPMAALANLMSSLFLNRLNLERPSLPVLSLCNDTTLALSLARDGQSSQFLSRQLRAQGGEGNILLVLAGFERDPLLDELLKAARQLECVIVLAAPEGSALLKDSADFFFRFDCSSLTRLMEAHLFFGDLLCELVEGELFGF